MWAALAMISSAVSVASTSKVLRKGISSASCAYDREQDKVNRANSIFFISFQDQIQNLTMQS